MENIAGGAQERTVRAECGPTLSRQWGTETSRLFSQAPVDKVPTLNAGSAP